LEVGGTAAMNEKLEKGALSKDKLIAGELEFRKEVEHRFLTLEMELEDLKVFKARVLVFAEGCLAKKQRVE
jgi:hypothetical protein